MKYLEPYAALTDDALAELANAGLLRRSRKLSGDVTEEASDATGATLRIAGHPVRVDARGPEAVTCECPTGGVCVHVVVACQWAHARAAELGVEAHARADTPVPAGTSAPANASAPADAPDSVAGAVPATGSTSAGPTPAKRPDAPLHSDTTAAVGRRAPAKRRTTRTTARDTRLAAERKRRAAALAEVRDAVVHLTGGGLAHLRHDTSESLRALAGRVRLAGFDPVGGLRLDTLLRTAVGQATALAGHDDTVGEADLFVTLTEIWALVEAHDAAQTHELRQPDGEGSNAADATAATGSRATRSARTTGRGRAGRDEDETDIDRLVPLSARWWTGASGSRGLTFAAWDTGAGRVRTTVTGRPSGTDPGFRRDWEGRLLWNTTPSRLSAGPFAVTAVRERPDGSLGAGGNPSVASLGEFDLDELREIAEHTGAAVPARDLVGFGRRPSPVRLLLVRDSGEIGIDEVRQELTWTVTDSTGTPHVLRVPVDERHTTDTLLHILAGSWNVVAVTTERNADRLEPAGVFLRGHDGAIHLVSPSLIEQYQLGGRARRGLVHWDAWRKRISRVAGMRSRARAVTTVREPDPPVVRACDLAWDVTVAMAATGRRRLTARQRSDVGQARTLARDLGLVTLERAIADLVPDHDQVGPETLARAAFLIRRTREIASVAR